MVDAGAAVVARVPVARRPRILAHAVLLEAGGPQVGQHLAVDDDPLDGAVERQHHARVRA